MQANRKFSSLKLSFKDRQTIIFHGLIPLGKFSRLLQSTSINVSARLVIKKTFFVSDFFLFRIFGVAVSEFVKGKVFEDFSNDYFLYV